MSAEERWADRLEREEERRRGFDRELKLKSDITGQDEICDRGMCKNYAVTRYNIGEVSQKGGVDVDLCEDHDSEDIAFEEYDQV